MENAKTTNWIGHILRRNCLLKQVIEGKIKGEMEVARRRGRRRKKLLDDLKDRRGYSHLKEEALDRTMWRHRFGGGFGPVARQNTEWMNDVPSSSSRTYTPALQEGQAGENWEPSKKQYPFGNRKALSMKVKFTTPPLPQPTNAPAIKYHFFHVIPLRLVMTVSLSLLSGTFQNTYSMEQSSHFGHGIVQCSPTFTYIQDLFHPNS